MQEAAACYQVGVAYPLDNALFQWEEGASRLRELDADPRAARNARRAVDAIRDELRRRIGPTFSAQELADLYGRGTDWCLEAARRAAPMAAVDLDPQAIVDGAFFALSERRVRLRGGRGQLPSRSEAAQSSTRSSTIRSGSIVTRRAFCPCQCSV